jgi:hypothetical protein
MLIMKIALNASHNGVENTIAGILLTLFSICSHIEVDSSILSLQHTQADGFIVLTDFQEFIWTRKLMMLYRLGAVADRGMAFLKCYISMITKYYL